MFEWLKRISETSNQVLRWLIIIALGVFTGIGLFVLRASNAISYLSDRSEACMNCHVMTTQFATWEHGGHRHVTNCNGCHVPHDHLYRKLFFKASDGLRHSFIFTFRMEPQVIRIKQAGINVVQENCLRCHSNLVHRITGTNDRVCWKCHLETPHGRINSLAATPYARVPRLEYVIPFWRNNNDGRKKNENQENH